MRIIYLHQYFNTPEMSGSTRSYEVGRRLVNAGHTVDIVTSWQEPTSQKGWFTSDIAGMNVHWLPVPYSNHMNFAQRIAAFFKFALRAGNRAASIGGDVVFATSTPLTISLPGTYAARRLGVPMVFEVRDLWPELPIAVGALNNPLLKWAARALEQFSYANSAAIVALSPGMAEGVARAGFPPEKITIVPNGSDLDSFRRDDVRGRAFRAGIGIAPEKILVAYVGTLGRINGVSYLVRLAAALAEDTRFSFLTVGDGQERDQVAALARSEGVLNRNFRMLPKVAKTDVPALLSAVDISTSLFLPIPQMEANSANKFFDALAAGCCVAINYGGWHAQLLQETQAGVRLEADPRLAAAALMRLADQPGQIATLGRNARRLAEDRFSRDDLAAKIHAVLANAVGAVK